MNILLVLLKTALVIGIPLGIIPLILHVERRGAGFIQRRLGPNRVGPFGLLQPLADVFKFLFKEDVLPSHVRPVYYYLAPMISLLFAILPLAGIPFCGKIDIDGTLFRPEVFHSDLGILFIFALTALGPYGILLAGWSSNNKFTVLGAIRACAQMISYELAMTLTVISLILVYGSSDIHAMIASQGQLLKIPFISSFLGLPAWGIFLQPIGALIFLVGIFAESNRLPFDLAEGESEIVAGYHLEYSSIKFAIFFMAEYVHVIVLSALYTHLFLGGYNLLPGADFLAEQWPLLTPFFEFVCFFSKVAFLIWLFVWVRWSLPRFRYDQLMDLGWKRLLPLALGNLIVTTAILFWKHSS